VDVENCVVRVVEVKNEILVVVLVTNFVAGSIVEIVRKITPKIDE
jgi:hypothetical protein